MSMEDALHMLKDKLPDQVVASEWRARRRGVSALQEQLNKLGQNMCGPQYSKHMSDAQNIPINKASTHGNGADSRTASVLESLVCSVVHDLPAPRAALLIAGRRRGDAYLFVSIFSILATLWATHISLVDAVFFEVLELCEF